jgi:hypothetical protein
MLQEQLQTAISAPPEARRFWPFGRQSDPAAYPARVWAQDGTFHGVIEALGVTGSGDSLYELWGRLEPARAAAIAERRRAGQPLPRLRLPRSAATRLRGAALVLSLIGNAVLLWRTADVTPRSAEGASLAEVAIYLRLVGLHSREAGNRLALITTQVPVEAAVAQCTGERCRMLVLRASRQQAGRPAAEEAAQISRDWPYWRCWAEGTDTLTCASDLSLVDTRPEVIAKAALERLRMLEAMPWFRPAR